MLRLLLFVSNKLCGPPAEQQDVHNFLLSNMGNGGILDLMVCYLKAVGRKFLEKWPGGLAAVVLEVYQTWRKHSSGLPNPLLRDCSNQHIRVNDFKTASLGNTIREILVSQMSLQEESKI